MKIIKQEEKEIPYTFYFAFSILSFITFGRIKKVEERRVLLRERIQELHDHNDRV